MEGPKLRALGTGRRVRGVLRLGVRKHRQVCAASKTMDLEAVLRDTG